MDLHGHLFFYQLDDKNSEVVFERDLLIHFGGIGTKKKNTTERPTSKTVVGKAVSHMCEFFYDYQ
jgi:hypothetical protein